ncbi:hypothetical protein [Crossiella cryophila]|uniref:Transmembrane protein n=1 Tax=Crossiella cryophila TaxID=43355 RepID=A0A7W7CA33_9PSEU|nr:hypothetical protein [Crossiella cryophila]MBB4677265.1 hypothetical protein [Crossiella cryophila]
MKLYADHQSRRTAQLLADLGALLIIAVSIWLALDLYDLVSKLRAPGVELVEAGGSLRELSASAAAQAGRLPLVGDELAAALGRGSAVADRLVDAGNKQMSAVDSTALWLSVLLVLVPVSLLLVSWLPLRMRFVRQATAARRLTRLGEAQVDLLALRGLANLPLHTLAKPGVDLVGAWRSGDREAVELLARAELRRLGLRLETGKSER